MLRWLYLKATSGAWLAVLLTLAGWATIAAMAAGCAEYHPPGPNYDEVARVTSDSRKLFPSGDQVRL